MKAVNHRKFGIPGRSRCPVGSAESHRLSGNGMQGMREKEGAGPGFLV